MQVNSDPNRRRPNVKRYLANLQGEIDSAALYRGLSEIEHRPEIAGVYQRLAEIEQAHAEFWKKRLSQLGHDVPELRLRRRTRALVWFAHRFGPGFVLPIATSLEHGESGHYDTQPNPKLLRAVCRPPNDLMLV